MKTGETWASLIFKVMTVTVFSGTTRAKAKNSIIHAMLLQHYNIDRFEFLGLETYLFVRVDIVKIFLHFRP